MREPLAAAGLKYIDDHEASPLIGYGEVGRILAEDFAQALQRL